MGYWNGSLLVDGIGDTIECMTEDRIEEIKVARDIKGFRFENRSGDSVFAQLVEEQR